MQGEEAHMRPKQKLQDEEQWGKTQEVMTYTKIQTGQDTGQMVGCSGMCLGVSNTRADPTWMGQRGMRKQLESTVRAPVLK